MRSMRRLMFVTLVLLVAFALLPAMANAAESIRIKSISFVDANRGYVAGTRMTTGGGFVSYTADGGATWQNTPLPASVEGVDAESASSASIVQFWGTSLYSTTDYGATWNASGPFGADGLNMADVVRLPDGVFVTVGEHNGTIDGKLATIWRSDNSGATWSLRYDGPPPPPPGDTDPPPTVAGFVAVDFASDGQTGWAVGTEDSDNITFEQVLAYKTIDGGVNWTPQTVPGAVVAATSLTVVSPTMAWIGCGNGDVFRTTNGSTWVKTPAKSAVTVATLDAISSSTAVVVGAAGKTSRTTDGGQTWSPAATSSTGALWSVDMVDGTHGYAGGDNVLIKTEDGGASWKAVTAVPLRGPTTVLTGTSGTKVTAYYAPITIYADLKAGTMPLSGKAVYLEYSPNGSSGWARFATTITNPIPGRYQATVRRTSTGYFRFRFGGDSAYAPSIGPNVKVYPKAWLTNPYAPTYATHGRGFTVYGFLKPRHTQYSYPVRIYKYRYVSGRWVSYSFSTARAYNYSTYTKYSGTVSLPYAGRWRLRAYAPADAGHYATWSAGYDYVTVK